MDESLSRVISGHNAVERPDVMAAQMRMAKQCPHGDRTCSTSRAAGMEVATNARHAALPHQPTTDSGQPKTDCTVLRSGVYSTN